MRRVLQVVFVFCVLIFGIIYWIMRPDSFDNSPTHQKTEIECDFYSRDAIYYSPGSTQEAKRKECEKKYYGYADSDRERKFNLGGIDLRINGPFGFVLNTNDILQDPRSYRGEADIYINIPIVGINGAGNRSSLDGLGAAVIDLKISYVAREVVEDVKPSWSKWDEIRKNVATGMVEYIRRDRDGFGSLAYVLRLKDGYHLVLSCKEKIGGRPGICIAHRKILPNYYISYHVNWSSVNNWELFDSAIVLVVFDMMGRKYE